MQTPKTNSHSMDFYVGCIRQLLEDLNSIYALGGCTMENSFRFDVNYVAAILTPGRTNTGQNTPPDAHFRGKHGYPCPNRCSTPFCRVVAESAPGTAGYSLLFQCPTIQMTRTLSRRWFREAWKWLCPALGMFHALSRMSGCFLTTGFLWKGKAGELWYTG